MQKEKLVSPVVFYLPHRSAPYMMQYKHTMHTKGIYLTFQYALHAQTNLAGFCVSTYPVTEKCYAENTRDNVTIPRLYFHFIPALFSICGDGSPTINWLSFSFVSMSRPRGSITILVGVCFNVNCRFCVSDVT